MAKCKQVTISFLFLTFFATLVNTLNISAVFADVQTYDWTITEIHAGQDPSLAVDSSGNPHLCFGKDDGSTSQSTHIFYANKDSGAWSATELAAKTNGCAETSIFSDTTNKIHLAYATECGEKVWYRTNRSGSWQEEEIKGHWTGNYESLVMDDNEKLHVCYWNNNNWETVDGKKLQLNYKSKDMSVTWASQPTEGLGSPAGITIYASAPAYKTPTAMAVTCGAAPVPHIIAGINSGKLRHYWKTGASWVQEDFANGYELSFDPNGTMYFDSNNALYCVLIQTVSGGKSLILAKNTASVWSYEAIAQLASGSLGRAALAIDPENNLHIAYFSGQKLYYGMKDGATWVFQEVAAIGAGAAPEDISMALTASGEPKIAYSTSNPKKIYCAEVYVPPINNPPVLDPIGAKAVKKGKLLTFTVTAQDIDGDAPAYSLETIPGENYPQGATIGAASGIFEWTPDAAQPGSYKLRIKAKDGMGGEDYEDVQITVQDINNPPVIEPIEPKTVKEGETLAFIVSARDPDGDPLAYSLEPIKDRVYPANAALEGRSGNFEWTPTKEDTGVYYAKVTVSDNKGGEDAAALLITLDGALAAVVPEGATIQHVIDDPLRPYKMIYIPQGTYYEDIIIDEKITLRGAPSGTTVIKGNITVKDTEAVIDNLTILYNEGYEVPLGEGQTLLADSGITAINANITVTNCHIEPDPDFLMSLPDNEAGEKPFGKGIQVWNAYESPDSGPRIENNVIQNAGCGVYYFTQAFGGIVSGVVRNNTLYNNKYGVLLRMHKEQPEIKNNIIAGSSDGVFVAYRDGDLFDTRQSLMRHNDVWAAGHAYWLDEDGVTFDITGVNGNISEDPLFIDAVNGDFTLEEGSPCKGAADDGGDMGVRISLLPAPNPPTVSSIPEVTKERYISIRGTKDINSSIIINGAELIPPNAATEWDVDSYDLGAIGGNKTLIFASKNIYGLESGAVILNVELDITPPQVIITSPLNGATLNEAPITVTGIINDPEASVEVNGVFAEITGSTFTAEGVDLRYGQNTITATAVDTAGNKAADDIIINSTTTSIYELIKITQDTYPDDPGNPVAGSQVELKAWLVVEGAPRSSEPIHFSIKSGNGALSQTTINTDINGHAAVILTTDANAMNVNEVEAYAVNFPGQKILFRVNRKYGQASSLLKITDDTARFLPGVSIDLITKLIDQSGNPIPKENITYSIISGFGNLLTSTSTTTAYGEAKVVFTVRDLPNTTTVIRAQSVTYPALFVLFNITAGQVSSVTFEQVMARVQENADRVLDLTADVVVTTNESGVAPEERYKIWRKGNKGKIEMIYPEQKTLLTTNTPNSIIIGDEELQISEYVPVSGEQKQDFIESVDGDIYVLKSVLVYPDGISKDVACYEVDYARGVITKMQQISTDPNNQMQVNTTSLYQEISGAWVLSENTTQIANFKTGTQYEMRETYSNIVINSGLLDSIFE